MTEKPTADEIREAKKRLNELKRDESNAHIVYADTNFDAVRYPYRRLIDRDKAAVYDAGRR